MFRKINIIIIFHFFLHNVVNNYMKSLGITVEPVVRRCGPAPTCVLLSNGSRMSGEPLPRVGMLGGGGRAGGGNETDLWEGQKTPKQEIFKRDRP